MTTKTKQTATSDSIVSGVDNEDKEIAEWKDTELDRSAMVCYVLPHVAFIPYKGDEPNWFHRLMQKLLLGVVWKKRTEIESK